MFYEPHIDHLHVHNPRLPLGYDGLTLLHLSDLHITRWTRRLAIWQAGLSHLRPHLICLTGDLGHRAWLWKTSVPNLLRFVRSVPPPPLGIHFILGNHDALKLAPALETQGLYFLENESWVLPPLQNGLSQAHEKPGENAEAKVVLIGIHQHRRIDTDIPTALRQVRPGDFKILMLHYPDLIHQAAAAGADVVLAGHTHGGQICWPDGRPILRHDSLSQTQCTGYHQFNATTLIVNRGIGSAGLRVRLFCPPHAVLVTLHRVK